MTKNNKKTSPKEEVKVSEPKKENVSKVATNKPEAKAEHKNECKKSGSCFFSKLINLIIFSCVIFLAYREYSDISKNTGDVSGVKTFNEINASIKSLEQKILQFNASGDAIDSSINEERIFADLEDVKDILGLLSSRLDGQNLAKITEKNQDQIFADVKQDYKQEVLERLVDEVDSKVQKLLKKSQQRKEDYDNIVEIFDEFYVEFTSEETDFESLEAEDVLEKTIKSRITDTLSEFVKVEKIDEKKEEEIEALKQAALYIETKQLKNFVHELNKIQDSELLTQIITTAEEYIKNYEGYSLMTEIEKISFLIETYKQSN